MEDFTQSGLIAISNGDYDTAIDLLSKSISKENEKEIKCNIKQIEIFPQIEYELILNFNELKKNHKLISFFPDINLFISFIIEKKNIRIEKKNENEINLTIKATMENLKNVEIKRNFK